MTKLDILNKIQQLKVLLAELEEGVYSLAPPMVIVDPIPTPDAPPPVEVNPPPVFTPPVVAPPQVIPPPAPISRETHHAGPMGIMVMDLAQPGTPGTVTMPVTGHVLSLPRPDGEGLMGYSQRISLQLAGERTAESIMGSAGSVGGMVQQIGDGGPQFWPEMLDRRYNAKAYMTDVQKAAAEAALAGTWISSPPPVSQMVDVPIGGQS